MHSVDQLLKIFEAALEGTGLYVAGDFEDEDGAGFLISNDEDQMFEIVVKQAE
jgi:hypothetical protein